MSDSKDNKADDRVVDGVLVVETVGRDFRVEGNDVSGYVGVDAEYRTYASETEKPYLTDEDVKSLVKGGQLTNVEQMSLDIHELKEREAATRALDADPEYVAAEGVDESGVLEARAEQSKADAEKAAAEKAAADKADVDSKAKASTTPAKSTTSGK